MPQPTLTISHPTPLPPTPAHRTRSRSRSRPRHTPSPDAPDAPQPHVAPKRKPNLRIPVPRAPPPPLPNGFTSPEQRHAALVARGLRSPSATHLRDAHGFMMPLSEQEKELDRRFAVVVDDAKCKTPDADSEARRIKEAWMAKNRAEADRDPLVGASESRSQSRVQAPAAAVSSANPDVGRGAEAETPGTKAGTQAKPSGTVTRGKADGVDKLIIGEGGRREKPLPPTTDERADPAAAHARRPRPQAGSSREEAAGAGQRRSSDVGERVSRWLQSSMSLARRSMSSERPRSSGEHTTSNHSHAHHGKRRSSDAGPNPLWGAAPAEDAAPLLAHGPGRTSPPSAYAIKGRQKPAPIVVTSASRPGSARASGEMPAGDGLKPASAPVPARGRGANPTTTPESGSRASRLPALSPTRTNGSSTPSESALPATPTTFSHGAGRRSAHGHGAQSGAAGVPPRVLEDSDGDGARALAESPVGDSEEEDGVQREYVNVEFGMKMAGEAQKMRELLAAAAVTPRPRPRGGSKTDSEHRKSLNLGLPTRNTGSLDAPPPFRNPRASNSMQNLRRSLAGTLSSLSIRSQRPKSSVEPSPLSPSSTSPPPMPAPPSSFPSALRRNTSQDPSVNSSQRKSTVGVGLRPRQALSPTMHDRGSILVEAGRIQDEESRRLSEMAFLDY